MPVLILRQMLEILDQTPRIALARLFERVRKRFDADVSDGTLRLAVSYLELDRRVHVTRGGTVVRRNSPSGRPARLFNLDLFDVTASLLPGRKTTRIVGRCKIAGGRRGKWASGRRKQRVAIVPARQPRSYREEPGEQYHVPIFYVTNRQRTAISPRAEYAATGVPVALDRGRALISFPPKHRRGYIEQPRWLIATLNPDRHVVVDKVERLASSAFHRALLSDLRKCTNALFVFVHGYTVSFDAALKRTAQLLLDTNFQGSAISFSWCSRDHWTLYHADQEVVQRCAQDLASLLAELRTQHSDTVIHLVAHSMGSLIAARAAQMLPGDAKIGEIVLQAPDISQVEWGTLAAAMTLRGKRTTVYTSCKDRALWGSAALRFGVSGRVGQNVLTAIAPGVDAIDATGMTDGGSLLGHNYAFRKPFAIDVRETLDHTRQVRVQLEARHHEGTQYYTFREPE
ncbi:MAG: alpha/beta hydrolase [Vulcanimicrobiaceae bacterium]